MRLSTGLVESGERKEEPESKARVAVRGVGVKGAVGGKVSMLDLIFILQAWPLSGFPWTPRWPGLEEWS